MFNNRINFGAFLEKLKFKDDKAEDRVHKNQISVDVSDDGAVEVNESLHQYMWNVEWSYKNQKDMINTYREISNYSVVDYAIEDIINEMVSYNDDEYPVDLDLSDLDEEFSEKIRDTIYEKWQKITELLDLSNTIHNRARRFYVDGRLVYQKVIDKNKPQGGLLDIVELDSRYVTKIRNVEYNKETNTVDKIAEFFLFDKEESNNKNKRGGGKTGGDMVIFPESLCYVTSGLVDPINNNAISWLHKAINPANKLRMMENSLVIYRITRSPERRIFYIDVAGLNPSKAESHINKIKNSYKNRMSFDPDKGSFVDQRHLQTMQEDFWLPRSSEGRGTEVTTLQGGASLGELDDVLFFQKQLYKSLNIPESRLESDNMFSASRSSEITRDELKFSKFVSRIRKRFNMMFLDLLKTELILTKVIDCEEWDKIKNKLKFLYAQDLYLEELRKAELLRDRLDLAREIKEHVGKYYSNEFVQRRVLKMTDKEIEEQDELIDKEKKIDKFKPSETEGY